MIDLSHSKMAFFQVWKCKHHMEHCELNHPLRGDLISKIAATNFKTNGCDWGGGKGGE